MKGYSSREVARMLDLSVGQVRSYARAGFIHPARDPRGAYRFRFQELVLLRAAKGLTAARIPSRRIARALRKLKERLPTGRALTELRISAVGDSVVVRDGRTLWDQVSGQTCFDFDVSDLAERVAPLARRAAREAFESDANLVADDWFEMGRELEAAEPGLARQAYERAVEMDPAHGDAHLNLGRLLHEAGLLGEAEAHYRLVLAARPADPTALFNLGVSLEDLGRPEEAIRAYQDAASCDPDYADAYYNLARLYEKRGNAARALHHLNKYRRLTGR